MWFLPISLALFLLFLVLIPVLFALAPAVAFAKLGLNPFIGYAFFFLCLLRGSINIPISREELTSREAVDDLWTHFHAYLIRFPVIRDWIITIRTSKNSSRGSDSR
jgi:uncharacterized membrane protein